MFGSLDRRVVDRAALTVLLLAAGAAAWIFGGVSPAVQAALCLVAAAALCSKICSEGVGRLAPAAIPALGLVALGVFQASPLPKPVLERLAPVAAERAGWTSGEPQSPTDPNRSAARSTSLDALRTRAATAMLAVTASFFLLAMTYFRRDDGVRFLLWFLAINAVAVAAFGVVQKLTWDGRMFWTWPIKHGSPFGPFVNRNNAAGFLNLGLAAAAGLMVLRSADGVAGTHPGVRANSRWSETWILPFALAGVIAAAVVVTLSRGGFLGLVAGTGVAALFLGARTERGRRGVVFLIPGLVATVIVFACGFAASLEIRLATLVDDDSIANDGRVAHWKDAFAATGDFWRCGSGLGTYDLAYRPHQSQPSNVRFEHADNQYLELLVEGGVPAVLLLLIGVVFVLREVVVLVTEGDAPTDRALGVACGFALGSQLLHACFDFGIILPANSLALALLVGAAVGRARALRDLSISADLNRATTARPAIRGNYALKLALVGLLLVLVPSFFTLRSWSAARSAIQASQWPADSREVPADDVLHSRIGELTELALHDPRQSELHERLADLWIRRFRRTAVKRLAVELKVPESSDALWAVTNPAEIQLQALLLATVGDREKLQNLRNDPLTWEYLTPAVDHFRAAAEASPSRAGPWLGLAQLAFLSDEPAGYVSSLARARTLAPYDLNVLLTSIAYDLESGRREAAVASLRFALERFPERDEEILKIATRKLSLVEIVSSILSDEPQGLVRFYRRRLGDPAKAAERAALARRLNDSPSLATLPVEERFYYQAIVARLEGDDDRAFESYRKAVELRPFRADWRITFAQDLFDAGRLDEAREQAAWCVRNAPDIAEARLLLDRIIEAQRASPPSNQP